MAFEAVRSKFIFIVDQFLADTVHGKAHHHGGAKPSRHRDITSRITDIVQALALCHNVTPVYDDVDSSLVNTNELIQKARRGGITYQASSPDEVSIVKWTELVGLMLVHRDLSSIKLKFLPSGSDGDSGYEVLDFEILHVFPFTSETKRMGIIVRDSRNGDILFYMKGADTVMSKIVQYNDWYGT
jgi:phospholipid-translocating ATPase